MVGDTKTLFFPEREGGKKRNIDIRIRGNARQQRHCNYNYDYSYKNRQTRLWRVLQILLLIDVSATAILDRMKHDSRTAITGNTEIKQKE